MTPRTIKAAATNARLLACIPVAGSVPSGVVGVSLSAVSFKLRIALFKARVVWSTVLCVAVSSLKMICACSSATFRVSIVSFV